MTWSIENIDLKQANELASGMVKHLDITFTEVDKNGLTASMPVDDRTIQPFGVLHGGATAALAETVGSFASHLIVMSQGKTSIGMEINAQHLRSVRSGRVHAKAEPVHLGRKIHVWDIRVKDDDNRLIAICKLTNMIIDKIENGQ
ncbi:MAG: hotdog fold thioesterase [Flavobacteriales bacterium]|nr:hotdog fold thioesterase [Flavobacteriales bacterium]